MCIYIYIYICSARSPPCRSQSEPRKLIPPATERGTARADPNHTCLAVVLPTLTLTPASELQPPPRKVGSERGDPTMRITSKSPLCHSKVALTVTFLLDPLFGSPFWVAAMQVCSDRAFAGTCFKRGVQASIRCIRSFDNL